MTRAPSGIRATARPSGSTLQLLSVAVAVAALVVACSNPSPSATPGATEIAGASQGPSDTSATPKPTAWPGGVVTAMIALGAADASFEALGNDLQADVTNGNLQQLLVDSGNGLTFLNGAQKNIQYLQGYPETKALGDALASAYQQMIDGLQQVHDSLESGNGAGVTAGFQQFVAGNTAYGDQRATLSDMSQEAIFMQRIYYR